MGVAKEGGFIKTQNLQITDVEDWPWIDRYLDATNMDLEDGSVDVFICNAVLHHFARPYKFIQDAAEKLKSGGRILLLEPYTSFGTRLGQCLVNLEGFNEKTDVFDPDVICNNKDDPWSANISVPKLLFQNKERFEREFKDLQLERFDLTECLLFILSGGVNWRVWNTNFSERSIDRIKKLDGFLVKFWPSMFAMSCRAVVVKK